MISHMGFHTCLDTCIQEHSLYNIANVNLLALQYILYEVLLDNHNMTGLLVAQQVGWAINNLGHPLPPPLYHQL